LTNSRLTMALGSNEWGQWSGGQCQPPVSLVCRSNTVARLSHSFLLTLIVDLDRHLVVVFEAITFEYVNNLPFQTTRFRLVNLDVYVILCVILIDQTTTALNSDLYAQFSSARSPYQSDRSSSTRPSILLVELSPKLL